MYATVMKIRIRRFLCFRVLPTALRAAKRRCDVFESALMGTVERKFFPCKRGLGIYLWNIFSLSFFSLSLSLSLSLTHTPRAHTLSQEDIFLSLFLRPHIHIHVLLPHHTHAHMYVLTQPLNHSRTLTYSYTRSHTITHQHTQ